MLNLSTRKLRFENLETRDLLAAASFDPMPIQSDQVLVSQERNILDAVEFTMNSVTVGTEYNLTTSNNAFPISKNVSLAEKYPSVESYFQEKNYTSFASNYEVTLNDRNLLFIQADKQGKVNTTKEVYIYDTKTKELLNVYSWSDLMMVSKFDNILDSSFDPNKTDPVSCEIVNGHIVVSVGLTNSSGRVSKDNIYGNKALKRFELTDGVQGADNSSVDTFFVNKNSSAYNYSDVAKYLQKHNYTSISDSYEVALNDRKLVFFQANKKVDGNNVSEIFSYDTKTKEVVAIQSWGSSKVLANVGAVESYSFNMAKGVPVSCRVIDNHALIQVGIVGRAEGTKTEYVSTASKSYNLLNSNTQPDTGNNSETTNPPSDPSNTPDNYTLPVISNVSLTKTLLEDYPEIKKYVLRNNLQSISKAYELSLSDRKVLFMQASRKIGNNSFSEVFTFDTKTKEISSIDSWAELMKQNQLIEKFNCSIDTASATPITCEIDGNYTVVTVNLNFDSDRSGNTKFQAFKRYELENTESAAQKYDRYFVNNIQSVQGYSDITSYLRSHSYNSITNSYEVALNDRTFVFVEAQNSAKKTSDIFVYDTKAKEILDVDSWSRANVKFRDRYSSISSLSFDTAYERPVICTIIDNCALVSVYYKGTSESAGRSYQTMVSRSFRLGGIYTQVDVARPYGPMPKEYYTNN